MYSIPSAHAARFAPGVRTVLKLAHGQTVYDLASVRLTSPICAGALTLGAVSAASLEAKLEGAAELTGETVQVTVRSADGAASLPLGTFVISECRAGETLTSLTGYDAALWALEAAYLPSASSPPATALAVLADICTQCGLTLGSTAGLTDQSVTAVAGYTCREMAGHMAALLGCNALIDRSGALALRWFADSGQSVTPDEYYAGGLKLEAEQTLAGVRMVKKTTVTTTDADGITEETEQVDTYEAGSGAGVVIEVENPFATQAIVDAVWARLHAALTTYRIGSCAFFGGLDVEPGDLLSITDMEGGTCAFPVLSAVLELDGGCKATVSAAGETETAAAGVQGPVGRLLSRIAADLGEFKELTADNFTAAVAKVNNLWADSAWVQNLFAQTIQADHLNIGGSSKIGLFEFQGYGDGRPFALLGKLETRDAYETLLTALYTRLYQERFEVERDDVSAGINYLTEIYGHYLRSTMDIDSSDEKSIIELCNNTSEGRVSRWGATLAPAIAISLKRSGSLVSESWIQAGVAHFGGNVEVMGEIAEGGTLLASKYAAIGHNHSGTYLPLTGGAITGDLSVRSRSMVLSDTSFTYNNLVAGVLTDSSKRIDLTVPLSRPLASGASVACTSLAVIVRHADGGYPYARSGSSGGTYTQLYASDKVNIWNNSATVRTKEVASITCYNRNDSIRVQVSFTYGLAKASGNTATVTNNVPLVIDINGTFTIS